MFVTLTSGNLALVQVDSALGSAMARLFTRINLVSWTITLATAAVLAVVIATPALAGLFRFVPIDPAMLAPPILAGLAAPLAFDLVKLIRGTGTSSRTA